jgi:hypothetical protein
VDNLKKGITRARKGHDGESGNFYSSEHGILSENFEPFPFNQLDLTSCTPAKQKSFHAQLESLEKIILHREQVPHDSLEGMMMSSSDTFRLADSNYRFLRRTLRSCHFYFNESEDR